MRRIIAVAAVVITAYLPIAGNAVAEQVYPTRTVRFIVPFGAGSATDITARLFADRLATRWGKPVIVENRPGADGLVAINAFVGAQDDHTVFFGPAGTFTVHPYEHERLSYDPQHDLLPIVSISVVVLAISMPASMNIDTVDQLVALAKAQPGKLNAAAANGISDFLLSGFIKNMGLQIAKVPYRDIMQAPNDLAEDRIQLLSTSLAVVQPLMQAGRIKVLAVTSRQRAPSAPLVPTATEAGYPTLTFESIGGVFGPRSMPNQLRERIAADFRAVAADPIIAARLADTGQIMSIRGPAEFAASVEEQRDKLAAIAKVLGLKAAQPPAQ
ncbi:MAG TPA: tripartite tricarboxylate transporter substrate binding protein [Xanthobacteraceae bacterium]